MLRLIRHSLLGLCTLGILSCSSDQIPSAPTAATSVPGGPNNIISDGSHSAGNPNFFFLPPLVGNPTSSPNYDADKFNGRLHPVMVVYSLPDGEACTGTPQDGPKAVAVVLEEEMYKVNWDTRAANLDANTTYRLCVMSSADGGTLLGFVDLLPISGGVKNARTGEVFAFNDGRTVPVKFRIEDGALSYDPANPALLGTEFTVDNTGGSITLADDAGATLLAAVSVPAGAVPAGEEVTIVLTQEDPQYTGSERPMCLPGGLTQSDECYQIRTEPALYQFGMPVHVEICVDASPVPEALQSELLVHKYNTTEGLQALPWAEPTIIGSDCTGSSLLGAASAVFEPFARWVGNLLAPPELSASVLAGTRVPKGLGGTAGSFSDFGGAVPSSAPQAPVGLTVPASATVGQAGLVAAASGGSGTGAFSFTSLTPSICSVDSASVTTGSITTLAAGTCSLTATKAADAIYMAATSDTGSVTVTATGQPTRILIDASRDGGGWWFPQTGSFNRSAPHQGKALADTLRALGYVVDELPRGMIIHDALFFNGYQSPGAYQIVVRAGSTPAPGSGTLYTTDEIQAYQRFLYTPGSSLLVETDYKPSWPPAPPDPLALILGLHFDGDLTGFVSLIADPITSGTDSVYYSAGSVLTNDPEGVTVLGTVSDYPVMGILTYGPSRVFFIGDINALQDVPQPLVTNVFQWLATGP